VRSALAIECSFAVGAQTARLRCGARPLHLVRPQPRGTGFDASRSAEAMRRIGIMPRRGETPGLVGRMEDQRTLSRMSSISSSIGGGGDQSTWMTFLP
jgi:hypothetical protein